MDPKLCASLLSAGGPFSANKWASGVPLEEIEVLGEELWSVSPDAFRAFLAVCPAVISCLADEERSEWEFPARAIFGGLSELSRASRREIAKPCPGPLSAASFRSLKRWAEQAVRISSCSQEAALEYLRSSAPLLSRTGLLQVEQWGQWAIEALPAGDGAQPSAAFLRSLPEAMEILSANEQKTWRELGARIARVSAKLGARYFSETPDGLRALERPDRLAVLDFARTVAESSPGTAFELLERCFEALPGIIQGARGLAVSAVRKRSEDRPARVMAAFEEIVPAVGSVPHLAQKHFAESGLTSQEISTVASAAFFRGACAVARELSDTFSAQWIEAGLGLLAQEPGRGAAYFGFRSEEPRIELVRWDQAVLFEDHRRQLGLLARALSGRDLEIKHTGELASRERAAATLAYPTSDGRTIYVPPFWADGTHEENVRFYRLAVAHHVGHAEFGTFSRALPRILRLFGALPDEALARDLFWIAENGRVDHGLRREYPGLASQMDLAFADALQSRAHVRDLAAREALVEILLRASVGLPAADRAPPELAKEAALLERCMRQFSQRPRDLWSALLVTLIFYPIIARACPDSPYRPRPPIPFRGSVRLGLLSPSGARTGESASGADAGSETLPPPSEELGAAIDSADSTIPRAHRGARGRPVVDAKGTQDREGDDLHTGTAAEHAGIGRPLRSAPVRARGPFYYDEWDYLQASYRRRWCCLREHGLDPLDPRLYDRIRAEYTEVIRRVRTQFQQLRPQNVQVIRRTEWGDEIDLTEVIQGAIDRKAGHSPSDKIFSRREKKTRAVSTLLLVDMSASTDQPVPGAARSGQIGKRVVDLEIESLVVVIEALEVLRDDYAIFGFSGCGKDQVEFYRVKEFFEPHSEDVKARISGIRPRQSTRMGPAIRHAVEKLKDSEAEQKILVLVSDGFPQDQDYGEDRRSNEYGLHDTKMALLEAKRQEVQPFCITVDQSGHDYLRKMCDPRSYLVIRDIHSLPEVLPRVLESLIR